MQKFTTIFFIVMLLPILSYGDIPETVTQQDGFTLKDGVALYENYCAQCHGKFEKTRIPYRRASRIASAIRTIGPMAKLNHLSALEIIAISKALEGEEQVTVSP